MTNEAAKKNGFQPAYPIAEKHADGSVSYNHLGLTKREHMVTEAMKAIRGKSLGDPRSLSSKIGAGGSFEEAVATAAVEQADALLEALER